MCIYKRIQFATDGTSFFQKDTFLVFYFIILSYIYFQIIVAGLIWTVWSLMQSATLHITDKMGMNVRVQLRGHLSMILENVHKVITSKYVLYDILQ